ncbi:hypothetical protein FLONG3_2875 [Fusarium longipes]|uniref:Uncharacterized protein n=1 Tax=Fusarium longipes TaxID=694270 RepID=A0A395T3J2_9HYPO|nr:hypothetical protein FLONG3_2875 [Fusarium longipes]
MDCPCVKLTGEPQNQPDNASKSQRLSPENALLGLMDNLIPHGEPGWVDNWNEKKRIIQQTFLKERDRNPPINLKKANNMLMEEKERLRQEHSELEAICRLSVINPLETMFFETMRESRVVEDKLRIRESELRASHVNRCQMYQQLSCKIRREEWIHSLSQAAIVLSEVIEGNKETLKRVIGGGHP